MDDARALEIFLEVAKRSSYPYDELRLLNATKQPPTRRTPGSILLPIRLWVPNAAFNVNHLSVEVELRNIESVYQ